MSDSRKHILFPQNVSLGLAGTGGVNRVRVNRAQGGSGAAGDAKWVVDAARTGSEWHVRLTILTLVANGSLAKTHLRYRGMSTHLTLQASWMHSEAAGYEDMNETE